MVDTGVPRAVDDFEGVLSDALDLVSSARSMPFSAHALVERDELLDLLEALRSGLPRELREARRILEERDRLLGEARAAAEDLLGEARHQASEVTSAAKARAERLLARSDLVRAAERRAEEVRAAAEADASRRCREADAYCDARLASLEGVLARIGEAVAAGRSQLAASRRQPSPAAVAEAEEPEFFDQDGDES